MYRVSPFVRHFAWALGLGIFTATLWVNIDASSYYDFIEWRLADLHQPGWLPLWAQIPALMTASPASLTPASLTSHGLMSLFMFFVGKELWEEIGRAHV